ncbi:YybH family protein [Candidatus Zixiibacteriota bacterium]
MRVQTALQCIPTSMFLFLLLSGCGSSDQQMVEEAELEAIEEIEAILQIQSDDWSRGDVEAFTSVYAEDCTYISATAGLVQGRVALTERYRTGYPGPEAMGDLQLDILEIRPAFVTTKQFFGAFESEDIGGMSIVARWTLTYPDQEPASGLTLIVFRRIAGEWQIVQDASM